MVWVALVSGESGGVLGAVNISYLPLVPVEDAHCGAVRPGRKAQTHNSEHVIFLYRDERTVIPEKGVNQNMSPQFGTLIFFFFNIFLAMQHGMWNLNSLTRD